MPVINQLVARFWYKINDSLDEQGEIYFDGNQLNGYAGVEQRDLQHEDVCRVFKLKVFDPTLSGDDSNIPLLCIEGIPSEDSLLRVRPNGNPADVMCRILIRSVLVNRSDDNDYLRFGLLLDVQNERVVLKRVSAIAKGVKGPYWFVPTLNGKSAPLPLTAKAMADPLFKFKPWSGNTWKSATIDGEQKFSHARECAGRWIGGELLPTLASNPNASWEITYAEPEFVKTPANPNVRVEAQFRFRALREATYQGVGNVVLGQLGAEVKRGEKITFTEETRSRVNRGGRFVEPRVLRIVTGDRSFFSVWNRHVADEVVTQITAKGPRESISMVPRFELSEESLGKAEHVFLGEMIAPDEIWEHEKASFEGGQHLYAAGLLTKSLPTVDALFPLFVTHAGDPMRTRWRLADGSSIDQKGLWAPIRSTGIHLRANASQDDNGGSTPVARLGSLDLLFRSGAQVADTPASLLEARWDSADALGLPSPVRFCAEVRWPLHDVMPGGQDDVPDDPYSLSVTAQTTCLLTGKLASSGRDAALREQPIVIPVGAASEQASGDESPFTLLASETSSGGTSGSLKLRIVMNQRRSRERRRVIVIDRHPFLVATVGFLDFQGVDTDSGAFEIANWEVSEAGGAFWEVLCPGNTFTIGLPPQAIGEDYEREKTPENGPERDLQTGKLARYRLGQTAAVEVESSYFRQRFVEPAWNLRRVLGYPGQRDPGARVVTADFELLYGMSGRINGELLRLRLSEMSARLGLIPSYLIVRPLNSSADPRFKAIEARQDDWNATVRLHHARLAFLQISERSDETGLSLKDHVRYALRSKALLKYPVDLEDEYTGPAPNQEELGIAGGVAWGFESKNIYEELWGNPVSVKGSEIHDPIFTSLGGYGRQRAVFSNGKTVINSDTVLGRVQYYSVERIGRIGVFHNRAKHVIVYERTVAPTEQFSDDQTPHLGRPVVRKVQEYVEILEHERDVRPAGVSADAPNPAGFARRVRFVTKRMLVKSAWGSDVTREKITGTPNDVSKPDTEGWEIPLWNADAAGKQAHLYPKPRIEIEFEPPSKDPIDGVKGELCDPDRIYFYTSTLKKDTEETDSWKAVREVDYPNAPMARPPKGSGLDDDAPDGTIPSAPPIPPGWRRFSFNVRTGEAPVNIVAGRGGGGALEAVIRNITVMRGGSLPLGTGLIGDGNPYVVLADAHDRLQRIVRHAQRELNRYRSDPLLSEEAAKELAKAGIQRLKREAKRYHADIYGRWGKLGEVLDDANPAHLLTNKAVEAGLLEAAKQLIRPLEKEMLRVRQQIDTRTSTFVASDEFSLILDRLREGMQFVEAGAAELERPVRDAVQAMEQFRAADGVLARVEAMLQRLIDLAEDKDQLAIALNSIRTAAREEIKRAAQSLRFGMQGAPPILSELFAPRVERIAAAFADRLTNSLTEIETQIDELTADQIRDRFATAATKLETDFANMADDLKEYVDALNTAAESFRTATQKLKTLASTIAGEFETDFADGSKRLREEIRKEIDNRVASVRKSINATIGGAAKDIGLALREANTKLSEAIGDELEKLLKFSDKGLPPAITEFFKKLEENIDGNLDELIRLGERLEKTLDNAFDELLGYVRRSSSHTLFRDADDVFRMIRAWGDPPRVPGLDLNVDSLDYFFTDLSSTADELLDKVRTSPVAALLDRVRLGAPDELLKSVSIRLPTEELLDRFVPKLDDIDLSTLMPDLGGLKLSALNLKSLLPDGIEDVIDITHGIDRAARRAWVQADVDFELGRDQEIFSLGPIAVRLREARLTARTRLEGGIGQNLEREGTGRLSGNWEITVGGTKIVTFVDTALEFDGQGHVRFKIEAEKIRLNELLSFVSDLVKSIGYSNGGLTIRLLDSGGIPVGVESVLSLPLPDMQGATTGIYNAHLGGTFQLRVLSDDLKPNFSIETSFFLSRKSSPFNVSIFILGGGGWIEVGASYSPETRQISTSLSIGMNASASLMFAFGPIRGGVYAGVGFYAELQSRSTTLSRVTIGAFMFIRGEVSLAGIISASIGLYLEIRYVQTQNPNQKKLIASGTLSVSIKICWCFKISFSVTVEYELYSAETATRKIAVTADVLALDGTECPYERMAEDYLAMFEEDDDE